MPQSCSGRLIGTFVASASTGAAAQEGGFSAFKPVGVTSDCVVPRIAEAASPGASAEVGPDGGEELTVDEARAAHDCVTTKMAAAYALSGDSQARRYIDWEQYSTAPYVSATHSNRYVMNYANPAGSKEYGKFEEGARLPLGSVLAKDSFAVNPQGEVVIGALSLMEKMPEGFNPEFGDWRYTMILPDGRVAGASRSHGSANVEFCEGCHVAVDETQGSLFFVPRGFRKVRR